MFDLRVLGVNRVGLDPYEYAHGTDLLFSARTKAGAVLA
jgi:hypothetical protein